MSFTYYKVGGCVRDELLGLKPKDIDYVAVYYAETSFTGLAFDSLLIEIAQNELQIQSY